MVSAINAALSGLNAATQRLNVSANNLANEFSTQTEQNGVVSNTPYEPQDLVQISQAAGGVSTQVVSTNAPTITANTSTGLTQFPNVDPAQQLINANIASYNAQGNIAVLKVEQKLNQSVLNIIS